MEELDFYTIQDDKPIDYSKVLFDEKTIAAFKLTDTISNRLSDAGIIFPSKGRPELSSIIALAPSLLNIEAVKKMKEKILTLENQPIGKVLRVEDAGGGRYNVAVVFMTAVELFSRNKDRRVTDKGWHKVAFYFRNGAILLLAVFIALSLHVIYLQRKQLYLPNPLIYATPESINIFYEDVNFKTPDNQNINGWFIPAKNADVTFLFCPGHSGNLSAQLARVRFFHDLGVNLMMFDYRGYGNSSGWPSEDGFYKDAQTAYDYLISRNDVNADKIVVIGESLGGAVASELCLRRKAKALVLESSIVSAVLKAKHLYPLLPVDFLLLEKFDALSKIRAIRIPKLFVHGLDDEEIAFSDAMLLYRTALSPKEFLPFRGSHNDDIFKISHAYKKALQKFLLDNNLS